MELPPDRQASAIQTGWQPIAGAIVAIMPIEVIPATVPEPCATRKITPMKYARNIAGITEVVLVPSRPTIASPIPVAVITDENEPPAPVISSTTPALLSASPAHASNLSRPRYGRLIRYAPRVPSSIAISLLPRKEQITGDSSNTALPRVPNRMQITGMIIGRSDTKKDGFFRLLLLSRAATNSATTFELWFTSFSSFQIPRL